MLLIPSNDFLRLELVPNSKRIGPGSLPVQSLRGLVPLVEPRGEARLLISRRISVLPACESGRSDRGSEALISAALFSVKMGERATPCSPPEVAALVLVADLDGKAGKSLIKPENGELASGTSDSSSSSILPSELLLDKES